MVIRFSWCVIAFGSGGADASGAPGGSGPGGSGGGTESRGVVARAAGGADPFKGAGIWSDKELGSTWINLHGYEPLNGASVTT